MVRDQYKYFRLEARELLDQLGKTTLEMEKNQADSHIQLLLRLAHTLKGAARVVKQAEIADRAHMIEDILGPYRNNAERVPPESFPELLGHLDEIRRRVDFLSSPESAVLEAPASAAAPMIEENLKVVRADLSEMDTLLESVSETLALLNGLRPSVLTIEQTRRLADLLFEQVSPHEASGTGSGVRSRQNRKTVEELRRNLFRLEQAVGTAVDQVDRELRQLREAAEQLRLVPVSSVFMLLERTARDAAQTLSKRVAFQAEDGDLRLDAHVLSVIQPALVQIVRNAVAHGIENDADRKAKGKTAQGRVAIMIEQHGGNIVFVCQDDGRGVNFEALRRAAIRRGLPETQAVGLDSQGLTQLLLKGGVSTSESVTPIAGRGVGLDIVREAISRLGGTVAFHSDQSGTRFELTVPTSLVSLDAIVLGAGELTVAIPLKAVRSSVRLAPDQISWGQSSASVMRDGVAYSFLPLTAALLGEPASRDRIWQGLLVADSTGSVVVGADRLVGTARLVIRPLPHAAQANEIVSGSWFDGEGDPQLVLDPSGLVAAARRIAVDGSAESSQACPVLIVDDSLTSRMLEQSILESAGFDVDTASSAEEGLEVAHRRRYALFLVDVEMPGMTGFDFVERVRADPGLRDIPAIMITSRSSPDDFARGKEVGAQGYMVKSEFDQVQLLSLIRSLVG